MDWRRVARYAAPQVEDAAAYLARLKRPLRAAGEPDMSLDSPLFRSMYEADQAYEQLAKGRTPNLRNAGGDLARIAGQAIRDENAAARAARNTPFLERALTNDPDGLLRYAGPLAAIGTTAAGGGLAIQNALEEKRRLAAQAAADAQELAAARPARMASLAEQQRVLDGMTPPDAEVYIDPAADADLQRSLADSSYVSAEPPEPPEARSAYHGIGPMVRTPYDEEPLIDTQYDMESMHDMFDPVASQVLLEDAAQDVYESLQASGYGNPVRIRSAGAVEGMARQQGLPTFPGLMLSGDAVPRRTPGEAAMRRKFYSGGRAND